MIGTLTAAVAAKLKARGIPANVNYGALVLDEALPSGAVVTVRETADVYVDAGSMRTPLGVGSLWCWTTCVATFRVAATKGGATEIAHLRRCRELVDAFALMMRAEARARRYDVRSITGDFVTQGDGPQPHGIRYELRFDVGRGVELSTKAALDGQVVDGTELELVPVGTVTINGGTVCAPEEN